MNALEHIRTMRRTNFYHRSKKSTHTPIFKAIIKQVLRFRFLSFGQKNGRKKAKEEDADDGGDEDGEKKTRMIYLWQF